MKTTGPSHDPTPLAARGETAAAASPPTPSGAVHSEPDAGRPAPPPAVRLDADPDVSRNAMRGRWMLSSAVDFLNHGCFGARLRSVSEFQRSWCDDFEAAPVAILDRRRNTPLEETKVAVGRFLGVDPADYGFVTNATDGINAVMASLRFEPGDEVATTSHVYNAVRQTMHALAARLGFTPRFIDVPRPCRTSDDVVEAIDRGLTERTRLLVVDHVTSPTAMRFPLERILERCAARGIDVLVDGAHAPGMLPLDVAALGAAYYVGNLHKWVCAPSGAAFLWVRPDRQDGIHPTVISHFLGEGFAAEFSWQGTRDISPWMSVPVAIEEMAALGGRGGWDTIRAHNHRLAVWVQDLLCRAWSVEPGTPLDGSMLGSMAAVSLPAVLEKRYETPEALHDCLYDEHKLEVPVFAWGGGWLIRPSCQVYNAPAQYERLATVISALAG